MPARLIAAGRRREAFAGWQRRLQQQIVAGGHAVPDHIEPVHQAGQLPIFRRAAEIEPGAVMQQQLERPGIARALGEMAMPMGTDMGTDTFVYAE